MSKAKILIVEDEAIVAEDIRFSLEANDYEVVGVFSDGAEALRQAQRLRPDLMLMDIRIEGPLDGIATAARIWDELGIPVVFLTAHSDEATLERAKASRPFAYLLKPFQERELCVTVEIALSKRPAAPLLELPATPLYGLCQQALAAGQGLDLPGFRLVLPEGELPVLDDRSVDMLDIALAIWLQQAQTPEARVMLRADDCLAFRGLQQQKSGTGQRGGYEDKWRQDVADQLALLAAIRLEPGAGLLALEPAGDYSWQFSPHPALSRAFFAPDAGRRTVQFSKRLLEYDPYRQKWEKRLARRLCWYWPGITSLPATLGPLLTELNLALDVKNPIRSKERLETALDTLRHDSLLARWAYLDADPAIVGKRGWLQHWLNWGLSLTPPTGLGEPGTPKPPQAEAGRQASYGFIRHIRAERGLSQSEVAAAIGLTQAQLSQIEAGARVQPATAAKIKAWILSGL